MILEERDLHKIRYPWISSRDLSNWSREIAFVTHYCYMKMGCCSESHALFMKDPEFLAEDD
jgi:hypothetical protein